MDQGTIIFAAAGLAAIALAGAAVYVHTRRIPKISNTPQVGKPELLKACGPITARQAVQLARKTLSAHTTAGALRGLTSGPDLDVQGRSCCWVVTFETASGQRTGIVTFGSSASLPGSALVARAEVLSTPPRPGQPLTEHFEDSPEALQQLIRDGAEFGSATTPPRGTTLAVRPDANGNPVWRLDVRGQTFETPFEEAA